MQLVTEEVIMMPWGELALKCWNSSTSPPILVIHGSSANAGAFDQLIPLLPTDYYYVCVDLPGHGRSAHFPNFLPLNFVNFVMALQRISIYFEWTSYSIMGHSIGGVYQLFLTAVDGKKVKSLIFIDLAITGSVQDPIAVTIKQDLGLQLKFEKKKIHQEGPKTYNEFLGQFMSAFNGVSTEKSAKCVLARDLCEINGGLHCTSDARKMLHMKLYFSEEDLLELCDKRILNCPTLLILPRDSILWFVYENFNFYKSVKERLANSHILSRSVVVNGGHCVQSDNAEAVAPVITSFLQDTRHLLTHISKL